jgi:hypothetical protein
VLETDVDGVPPGISHRTESGEPVFAVEALVNVNEPPGQTTVSLTVKDATAVGAVTLQTVETVSGSR